MNIDNANHFLIDKRQKRSKRKILINKSDNNKYNLNFIDELYLYVYLRL